MIGNSGDNTSFSHELLSTNRQVANLDLQLILILLELNIFRKKS